MTDNCQRDPRLRYTPSDLPLYDAKPFPMTPKWAHERYKALPLTTDILRALEPCSLSTRPSSKAACIFDAICLGLQTNSRCIEYCHGNPTSYSDKFFKVPMSIYSGTFAGYPIAFINTEFSFFWNPFTLYLPPTPSPKPLISEFAFDSTNEAPEISRNGPSAASQQIDHCFVPS